MKTPFDDYPQTFAIQLPEEETEVLLKAHGDKLLRQSIEGSGPDTVVLTTPKGKVYVDEIEAAMPVIQIPTTFYMFGATVHCLIAGEPSTFNFDTTVFTNLGGLEKAIATRNDAADFALPDAIKKAIEKEAKSKAVKSDAVFALRSAKNSTFAESKAPSLAIIDGQLQNGWKPIDGRTAMIHTVAPRKGRRKTSTLHTLFDVQPDSALARHHNIGASDLNIEWIKNQLQCLGFEAALTFKVLVGTIIAHENLRPEMSIDDIIDAINRGQDARQGQREELRAMVYNWILCFDSMPVVGLRSRAYAWKEPRDKTVQGNRQIIPTEDLHSEDPLIKIIGRQGTAGQVPKLITLTAGAWIDRWQGNREILSDFGRVKDVASIRRGQPSGAWAASILLGLQQFWREEATHATRNEVGEPKHSTLAYRPITRRELLIEQWRPTEEHSVQSILDGPKPKRATEYWNAAIKILKERGFLGHYRELEPLPETNWHDAWLDQQLDMRPTGQYLEDALEIHQLAKDARERGLKTKAARLKKTTETG